MSSEPEVAIADIVNDTLQATDQHFTSKTEEDKGADEQKSEADKVADNGVTQAPQDISVAPASPSPDRFPSPERSPSPERPTKRQKTEKQPKTENAALLPPSTSSLVDDEEPIRCICHSDLDTGSLWISCERCAVWQHTNCMRLTWSADEAAHQRYVCEECAPEDHVELLAMLKKGLWAPLAVEEDHDHEDEEDEDE